MKKAFVKMQASGNDFIVIDNRDKKIRDLGQFAKKHCSRHFGIGADGILAFEKSKKAAFKMRIINADGSEAEMCGNGSRCMGLFASTTLGLGSTFEMETGAGLVGVKVAGKLVRVRLSDPVDLRKAVSLSVEGKKLACHFVNTGVPHAVIFVKKIESYPVEPQGKAIRFHKHFAPKGTNVNFVELLSKSKIRVRTYERGVGETQACGTGSAASAILSVLTQSCSKPVSVLTSGKEILKVDFEMDGAILKNVTLEGQAHRVYEGNLK